MDLESTDFETEDDSESEGSSTWDSSDESRDNAAASAPPAFVQKLMVFAAGMRLLLSTVMNTAGKVVVTVQLGMAGTAGVSQTIKLHMETLHYIRNMTFTAFGRVLGSCLENTITVLYMLTVLAMTLW